jgi:predicted DNA-binding protein (MmcQ/YjbR family)
MKAMKVDAIRVYCLDFPEAKENLQWGDELCFKVGGKIFVMLGLDNPRLCFKCTPEAFAQLSRARGRSSSALCWTLQMGDARPIGCGGVG